MSLFERPHQSFSTFDVVMGLKPEALREVDDYSVWVEKVEAELVAVYGPQAASIVLSDMTYATRDAPTNFASRVSAEMFQRLREYKAILAQIDDVVARFEEQGKALQLAEAELAAAQAAGNPVRQHTRNVREAKTAVAQLRREEDNLNYERARLSQQLENVFKAEYVRVSFA